MIIYTKTRKNFMNAQKLLEKLTELKNSGIDLSKLEVIVDYCTYDQDGLGWEGEKYPDFIDIDVERGELRLS